MERVTRMSAMQRGILALSAGALALTGACVWIGSAASALAIYVLFLYPVSFFFAGLAIGLGVLDAALRHRTSRGMALFSLLALTGIGATSRALPVFDLLARGPFCSHYVLRGGYTCAQSAPLGADILYLAPLFALPIAALLSIYWPHDENALSLRRETPSSCLR